MINADGSLAQNPNVIENEETPDFTADDLVLLKEMLLSLEKAIDEISLPNLAIGGETFTGGYIFSLLEKANVSLIIKNCFQLSKYQFYFNHFQFVSILFTRSHNVM